MRTSLPLLFLLISCETGEASWTCNLEDGSAWSEGVMACGEDCDEGARNLADQQADCADEGLLCFCSRSWDEACSDWRQDQACSG